MEHTAAAVVVPLATTWNDVGGAAIWDVSEHDAQDNVAIGDVVLENVHNSYLRSESRMIAAVGVDNLVVVETADAILVANKDQVQHVKAVVDQLKQQSRPEVIDHTQVYRPRGSYESIVNAQVPRKRIIVNPRASLSLQLHHHRSEHWVVVKGCGLVTHAGKKNFDSMKMNRPIPIGVKHRLRNPGKIPLEIIGNYKQEVI